MRTSTIGGAMSHLALPLVVSLSTFLSTTPVGAQAPDPARVSAAREMMQVAGVAKQFDELMPLLVQQLSQSFVAVAPEKADEIRQIFAQLPGRFIDRKGELIERSEERRVGKECRSRRSPEH